MNIETSKQLVVRTLAVGGAAGDGVREAGVHVGEFVQHLGCHAFLAFYYPSLIRGGHNFGRVSFSPTPVFADHQSLDMYIALSADAIRIRQPEFATDAFVVVEKLHAEEAKKYMEGAYGLPMIEITKELNAPHSAAPSVGIGAVAYVFGISRDMFVDLCAVTFTDLVGGKEINTALALRGYDLAKEWNFPVRNDIHELISSEKKGVMMEGNKAVGKGFQSAGLEFYVAYPMTPATSILTYLAKESAQGKLKVVHPEDEIAVLTMALGVAYTGTRTAIGTANGGFALMQEAFSFAGVSELPIACAVSQRQGPATGVATHTGQSDLRFVIHAGHGEFPRLVLAPGDVDECFETGRLALNLAWKYQIPTIVLLDKHISESHATTSLDMETKHIEEGSLFRQEAEGGYKRFTITDSGVSPMAFPGTPHAHVKATSYEHDEFGSSVDEAHDVLAMQDKRWRKLDGLKSEFANYPTIKTSGDMGSATAIVFWGSTKGAVLEAGKYINTPVRYVQIIWMEPFDEAKVSEALRGVSRVVVVEANHGAQLAGLIREKTGIAATETITRYDSEPFEPTALAAELRKRFGEAS